MIRALTIGALFVALGWLLPAAAIAAGWQSAQPVPSGAGEVPEPLGAVGDIEFWAPNRGVLITAGEGGMPAGIYAYDGTDWHLYSTVCGGHEGRIAWVGPDEFWTISDQQEGQEKVIGESQPFQVRNRSICHFKDGQVVASYGEPIGQDTSYMRMTSVACSGPDDCWFGGERLPGTVNAGAFHLHWDGQSMTAVPSLLTPEAALADPGRAVGDLAFSGGRLYESVQVQASDGEVAGEPDPAQPSFLHLIEPGAANPFVQLFTEAPLSYGSGVQGSDLAPFRFTSNGEQLWALAGAGGGKAATVTLLRLGQAGFAQVPLLANSTFSPSDRILGLAAEPGTDRIWVSFRHAGGEGGGTLPAQITAIHSDGTVDPPTLLPAGPGVSRRGSAGPISCPAFDQCWMATEKGWLFHLGGPLPQDTDPAMHQLITYRPPDDSVPSLPPAELPVDDSGSEPEQSGSVEEEVVPEMTPRGHRKRPLVADVHQQVVHETVLELSFTLRARAHVWLLARRGKRVVARTPRWTMGPGRHTLHLRLNRRNWPTSLDFQAHQAKGKP